MKLKPETCRACPNFNCKGFTHPQGKGIEPVLLVGTQPSETDVMQELASSPYSEAGSVLRRALSIAGLSLDNFTYFNLTQCHGSASREALSHCAETQLRPLIERLQPKVVVALGDTVTQELTGLAGPKTSVRYTRGYLVPGRGPALGAMVKITMDPAMLREGNMHLLGALAEDLGNSITQVPSKHKFHIISSDDDIADWFKRVKSNSEIPISTDIETPHSLKANDEEEHREQFDGNITQIQFASAAHEAIVLPWSVKTKDFTNRVMSLPNRKLTWNGYNFDFPRLQAEGIEIAGPHTDLMPAWHFLEPDLPMNLSFAVGSLLGDRIPPWKHTMQQDMGRYGALDVITLQLLYGPILDRLVAEDLFHGYRIFIERFQSVLSDMSRRGLPIDIPYREQFRSWLQSERAKLFANIQRLVPDELKDAHPKQGYKRVPPISNNPETAKFRSTISGGIEALDKDSGLWLPLAQRKFGEELRWCRVKPFLVNSAKQVQRYAAHYGHTIPRVKDGNEWKESAGKKELRKVARSTGDNFYSLVIDLRELGKIESTYIDGDGWTPDSAARVHTEYHFAPASGQIGSRRPNVQNIPKPGKPGTLQYELALRIRRSIAAEPGYKIVELDMSGFHAQTLAYIAKDRAYARVAAIDPHSFLAAHMLGVQGVDTWIDLSDQELAEKLSWVKANHEDIRNKKAKPAILGIGFGMGAGKLYRLNEDSFANLAEAKAIRGVLEKIFPRIFEWQKEERLEAHTKRKLVTPFGCVRRFWDIYHVDHETGELRPGSQAEECIAFRPSNFAHCHLKLAMNRMDDLGYFERYGLFNMIHDSVMFHCPTKLVDECVHNVRTEMERKSTILIDPVMAPEGFWVAADAMVGDNWADIRKVK